MTDIENIKIFYNEAFIAFNGNNKIPEIEAEFYPYIGINHTIRVRDGKVFVRIAEMFAGAPADVQKALAYILVAKLLRKKISPQISDFYRKFVQSPQIHDMAMKNKRAKGRKIITTAAGEVYNLDKIFAELNETYFQNSIPKPVLTWSRQKTFRILGHHDSTHKTIVVSKSLDNKKVPPFVVEFVVFHEMLHVFHPTIYKNNRRYNHTRQFRADEKKFARFEKAEDWIERNVKNLKRNARNKSDK